MRGRHPDKAGRDRRALPALEDRAPAGILQVARRSLKHEAQILESFFVHLVAVVGVVTIQSSPPATKHQEQQRRPVACSHLIPWVILRLANRIVLAPMTRAGLAPSVCRMS